MKASLRKKLEKAGWYIGDAKDFLVLSDEESAYLEIKIALTEALIKARSQAGISQLELAKIMHSSQSRVAKMEAGDSSVSMDLLIKALLHLGLGAQGVSKRMAYELKKAA
jgi:predicted XRE-type DNA-binding protein